MTACHKLECKAPRGYNCRYADTGASSCQSYMSDVGVNLASPLQRRHHHDKALCDEDAVFHVIQGQVRPARILSG